MPTSSPAHTATRATLPRLIHLWKMREELHYPLAGQTRRYLEAKQREAEEAAAAQARAAAVGMMPEVDNASVVGGDGSPVI